MSDYNKIDGQKLIDQFKQLVQQKILLKISVPHHDYEQLTVITKFEDRKQSFQIDPPKGLTQLLMNAQIDQLHFEFTSKDRVPQKCIAKLQSISENEIWLQCPPYIQRHQLRNNFRVNVPAGAYALLTIGEEQLRLIIHNISLGGVYCYCPNNCKSLLENQRKLKNLELHFPKEMSYSMIAVHRAIVRRMERSHRARHCGVAFEFEHIKKEARKRLTQQIYELQRLFLKNRIDIG